MNMNEIITTTTNFQFIKFDGQHIYNLTNSSADKFIALKELRLLKKLINAEKRNINIQIREQRAAVAPLRLGTSIPKRGLGKVIGLALSWAKFGVRASSEYKVNPLQNSKTFCESLLLECDYLEVQLNNL